MRSATAADAVGWAAKRRRAAAWTVGFPNYILPFDLLITMPFVGAAWYDKALAKGAEGGALTCGRKTHSAIGSFQIVLGREVGLYVHASREFPGLKKSYRSIELDLPLLEWTPFRTYSDGSATALKVQLGAMIDFNKIGNALLAYIGIGYSGGVYFWSPK